MLYGMMSDRRSLRITYQRTAAMELVDGKMEERLAAGGDVPRAKALEPAGRAARNRPDGIFTCGGKDSMCAWSGLRGGKTGVVPITREADVR